MPENYIPESAPCRGLRLCLVALAMTLAANPAIAARSTCDGAAEHASRETGVPLAVLQAVTRVETGRSKDGKVEPWPWAINRAGESFWFDTADAALAFAFRQVKTGVRNFDVGCFQLNYRWHGNAFSSLDDMFDPTANALYAARFLADLHGEFNNWEKAAGAYHSRTKKYADRYKARYRQIRAAIDVAPPGPAQPSNRRLALEPGSLISTVPDGHRMPGSLVALSTAGRTAFVSFD